MKPLLISLLVLLLAGCQTEILHSASVPTAADRSRDSAPSQRILIEVSNGGGLTVDGWRITIDQLPALVKIRHATSALIEGEPLAPYGTALQVREALLNAGVKDVKIAVLNP